MNIKNPELIQKLATFKPLFQLKPTIVATGQFIPVDWSRGVIQEPEILKLMAKEFFRLIDFSIIDVVAGIELQGVTLATAIALETGKPMVIVREKPKRPGRSPIVGDVNFISAGVRVLLVDDLMAYGGTKEERIKLLEERGAKVTDIAVFIKVLPTPPNKPLIPSYNFKAAEWLQERGIGLHYLIDYPELARLQLAAGVISQELCEIEQKNSDGPYWERGENLLRVYKLMKKEGVPIEEFVVQFMKEHGVEVS
ncbi:hypothetical protein HYW17_05165 [Candidatus Uhrbacteria bacterium]|nr:hypothetical protein [Candidatus Uhrbacteria bacterium]